MARMMRDTLILSDSERRNLRKNLLRPASNPERDVFLRSIDDLEVSFTPHGFTVQFPDLILPDLKDRVIVTHEQIKTSSPYMYSPESVSIRCVYQDASERPSIPPWPAAQGYSPYSREGQNACSSESALQKLRTAA